MKRLRKIGLIILVMAIIMGMSAASWSYDLVGSYQRNNNVTWTAGTSHYPNSDPAIGLDFNAGGTATYSYDIPVPTVSAIPLQYSIPSNQNNLTVNAQLGPSTPTLTGFQQPINFNTNFFFGYSGWSICAFGRCLTVIPEMTANFGIPNLSYGAVTLTTEGSGQLSGISAQTGPLWNLQGDIISAVADADLGAVSGVAEGISLAGFYLNAGIGMGVQETSSIALSFFGLIDDISGAGGMAADFATQTREVSVPDHSPGIHTFDYNTYLEIGYDFITDYDYYAVATLDFGNGYIDWNQNLLSGDLGSFDVGTRHGGTYFDIPVTIPVTYEVIGSGPSSIPEPTTMLLLGLGLIGLAGVRRRFR
jgi:hypothetical protein